MKLKIYNSKESIKTNVPIKTFLKKDKFNSLNFNSIRLPNNKVRLRCSFSGRSRSVLKKFRMSTIVFRKLSRNSLLPGVSKTSW